jgi:hypothetical protein
MGQGKGSDTAGLLEAAGNAAEDLVELKENRSAKELR